MTLVYAYRSLGITRDITITPSTVSLGAADKLRARIQHRGRSADLFTVTSDAATANGSSFTKNYSTGVHRLRIDASDLSAALIPDGIYTLAIEMFDNADTQEWKKIDNQVFALVEK